jgi:hypothetical protein
VEAKLHAIEEIAHIGWSAALQPRPKLLPNALPKLR